MSQLSSLRHALKTRITNPLKLKLASLTSPATLNEASYAKLPTVATPTSNAGSEPVAQVPVAAPQVEVPGATCTPQELKNSEDINRYINEGVLPGEPSPNSKPVPMVKSMSVFSEETPTLALPRLIPRHWKFLTEQCGIDYLMIAQRGYSSIPASPEGRRLLRSVGFTAGQVGEGGGLLIPQRNIIGMVTSYVYRADQPRLDAEGCEVEFERLGATAGALDLDIPATLHDPSLGRGPQTGFTIWTTNPICADSATNLAMNVVNTNGLALSWNDLLSARVRGNFSLDVFDGFADPALFVFNSDWSESDAVYATLSHLMKFFALRGQRVKMAFIAPGPRGQKHTLSGFIAQGGTLEELLAQSIFSPGSTS